MKEGDQHEKNDKKDSEQSGKSSYSILKFLQPKPSSSVIPPDPDAWLTLGQLSHSLVNLRKFTTPEDVEGFAGQVLRHLNELNTCIHKHPPPILTAPLPDPVPPDAKLALTPQATTLFSALGHCLDQALTIFEETTPTKSDIKSKADSKRPPPVKSVESYAAARRLFHCLAYLYAQRPELTKAEGHIPALAQLIPDKLLARLTYNLSPDLPPRLCLWTGMEQVYLYSLDLDERVSSFSFYKEKYGVQCIICHPLLDAIRVGMKRAITILAGEWELPYEDSFSRTLGGIDSFIDTENSRNSWIFYQKYLPTAQAKKDIKQGNELRKIELEAVLARLLLPPLTNIVKDYSEEVLVLEETPSLSRK